VDHAASTAQQSVHAKQQTQAAFTALIGHGRRRFT
jgi:hypothetical protein